MRSMPGNPYDVHTLAETLEQMGIPTGQAAGDRNRGQGLPGCADRGRAHAALRPEGE